VPAATLKLRLGTNRLTGTVPDGVVNLFAWIQDRTGGVATGGTVGQGGGGVTVGPHGPTFDLGTLPLDLDRGDPAVVSFVRGGDEWVLFGQSASVVVRAGSQTVLATGPAGTRMTVTLTSGGGVERGVLTRTIPRRPYATAGRLVEALKPDGVAVEVGDVLTATGLAGSFTVPDLAFTVDKATNTADFTCPPGSTWMVAKDELIRYTGVTVDGAVHVDEVAYTTPIPSGRIITAWCELPSGFAVSAERTVP
jgi:hypothetical protein